MTGRLAMRLLTLASGPAIALLLAFVLTSAEGGRGEVIEGSIDAEEPLLPSHGPERAPTPNLRADALLKARLEGGARGGPHHLSQLLGPPGADPMAAELSEWDALVSGGGGWSDLYAFLRDKPGWPGAQRLRTRAERLMPETLSVEERLAFFADARPATLRGARLFGEALIDSGQPSRGRAEIVRGWRELVGSASEESIYLDRHGDLIEPHHPARFEMLVWRLQLNAANRIARLLPPEYNPLMQAITALIRRRGGVDRLIANVPAELSTHPALAYARMVWREGRRRRADAEQAMRDASGAGALGDPEAWADERVLFVREAWEDGRHQDALDLAEGHGLTSGRHFAELEWLAGLISLKEIGDPARALGHFGALYYGTTTPISRARGAYWAGRAAREKGDETLAEQWFRRAAAYPVAFYGQMAILELGEDALMHEHGDVDVFRSVAGLDAGEWSAEAREMAEAATRLYRAGDMERARAFLVALAEQIDDGAALLRLARIARQAGDSTGEIRVAQAALDHGVQLWTSLYPQPRFPDFDGRRVEPALLLAVARQESRFMVAAESHAGARGLMQLMPGTARGVARQLGVTYDRDELVANPAYNLELADAFLADLIAQYDGSYVLAVAAYNAGPGNVNRWLDRFGDPRDPDVDVIYWVESIPFKETRNYVQRVLEAAQVYRISLGGGSGALTLMQDVATFAPAP